MRAGVSPDQPYAGVREVLVSISKDVLPAVTSKMETDSVRLGVGGREGIWSCGSKSFFFPQYYFVRLNKRSEVSISNILLERVFKASSSHTCARYSFGNRIVTEWARLEISQLSKSPCAHRRWDLTQF